MSKAEFTLYVENVFRLQNSLTRQVMMYMEGDESNRRYAPLLVAEQAMHKACRYLNEYASLDNEGLNISFSLQRSVEKTAADCEQSAHSLQQLLANYHE